MASVKVFLPTVSLRESAVFRGGGCIIGPASDLGTLDASSERRACVLDFEVAWFASHIREQARDVWKNSERMNLEDDDLMEQLARLELALQSSLRGRVYAFRIVVRDQGIVLQGRARTYYAKQLAQHEAMEAGGFPVLVNDIEVV